MNTVNKNFKRKVEEKEPQEQEPKKTPEEIKEEFTKLVTSYVEAKPWTDVSTHELEVKFGTMPYKFVPKKDNPNFEQRIKNKTSEEAKLNRTDYDNVFKELISVGFRVESDPKYLLRINQVFKNKRNIILTSRIRVELEGLDTIQTFCSDNKLPSTAVFNEKKQVQSVKFEDFNFSVSYSTENKYVSLKDAKEKFDEDKKKFRYINRVTLVHDEFPVKVDLSIIKSSIGFHNNYQINDNNSFLTVAKSGVFTAPETYEIEIEIDNNKLSSLTDATSLLNSMRTVIKFVLRGLQSSAYPIGFDKKEAIRREYNELFKESSSPRYLLGFVGPQPVTLQLENVIDLSSSSKEADPTSITESSVPNIREGYVVTEKADGERNFLFIDKKGDIYLINSRMTIRFTGANTTNENCFNTLLDGELITENKQNEHINLFAAFDLYFCKGKDYRLHKLIKPPGEETTSRYEMLQRVIEELNARLSTNRTKPSPMSFIYKTFYEGGESRNRKTIFDACKTVLEKENTYEYKTDGLIFTPAFLSVGGEKRKKQEIKNIEKLTWPSAFKWKPPEFNTVDFLVSTLKKDDGMDKIIIDNVNGRNTETVDQAKQYKAIQLMVIQRGIFNACDVVLKDDYQYVEGVVEGKMQHSYSKIFQPVNPADPNYGICQIELNEAGQMTTESGEEVFDDKMVVEFKYKKEPESRWVPIRVRYDKKNGNSYNVADSNWNSIHYPVTREMLTTGNGLGDLNTMKFSEEYYSGNTNDKIALRKYHNYYKSKLIKAVSINKDGNEKEGTLIDLAAGRGGDLTKWIFSNYKFVLGIELYPKGVEETCQRYVYYRLEQLKFNKKEDEVLRALFLQGNSSLNIKSGEAVESDTAQLVINTIFKKEGTTLKNATDGGIGHASKIYGIVENGFNVTSCQFAIHYFFKDLSTLKGFLTNVTQCTKLGGYFIGTTYDGKRVFDLLQGKPQGAFIEYTDLKGKVVCRITKLYQDLIFKNNYESLGKKIGVSQESIGEDYEEYLVNFEYFIRTMELFGFIPVSKEEAERKNMDLPNNNSIDSLNSLRDQLVKKINKDANEDFLVTKNIMSIDERNLSALSNYFVFKKARDVNIHSIVLEQPPATAAKRVLYVEEEDEEDEGQDLGSKKASFYEDAYTVTKLALDPIVLTKDKEDTSIATKKKTRDTTKDKAKSKRKKTVFEISDDEEN